MPSPLRDSFDRMMCGKDDRGLRSALLEAFMAGAAAYGRIIDSATESGDPEHVAKVMDALAAEIKNRHT